MATAILPGTKSAALHPYYPLEVEIVGFLANNMPVPMLLGSFAVGVAVISSVAYALSKRAKDQLSTADVLTVIWFAICKHAEAELELSTAAALTCFRRIHPLLI